MAAIIVGNYDGGEAAGTARKPHPRNAESGRQQGVLGLHRERSAINRPQLQFVRVHGVQRYSPRVQPQDQEHQHEQVFPRRGCRH